MPTYFARKSGNINAADVWATTPSGTASNLFPTFTNSDVLMANSFAITVNVSATVAEVRNDITGGATVGGTFALTDGVTLSANVFTGTSGSAGVSLSTGSAAVNGNITVPSTSNGIGVQHTGTGVLTISSTSISAGLNAAVSASSGTVNCTSTNITAGNGTNCHGITALVANVNASQITGGSNSNCVGVNVTSAGTITGLLVGGSNATAYGANTPTSGTLTITGAARGGTQGAGVNNTSGVLNITRAIGNGFGAGSVGFLSVPGVSAGQNSQTNIEQIEYGILGQSPTSGPIRLKKANTNVAVFTLCDTAGAKTLIDATANAAMPAATDVRSGVSYASGAITGSCAVPAVGSVALGVPVDATTGTAVLTAAAIRTELETELGRIDAAISSRLAPSGTLATVTTLTNAPTVPSASAIASQVRTELSVELARVDQNISSRLAAADYNAPTSAPTAASVANAVWSAATKEITGGTVTTLTNAPTVPSASAIASQVRTELATELANLDATVSSRLASSAYTAPANSDITAIKSKTDNLPASPAATGDIPSANITAIKAKTDLLVTDRLAQGSTVSTTGAQLAAALS